MGGFTNNWKIIWALNLPKRLPLKSKTIEYLKLRTSIITTTGSQLLAAFINVGVLLLASNELGRINLGVASLIMLTVTFTVLVSGFAGGGSVVYLATRMKMNRIIGSTYGMAVVSSLVVPWLFVYTDNCPREYVWHAGALGLLQTVAQVNGQLLLGWNKILVYNLFNLVQPIGLLIGFVLALYVGKLHPLDAYMTGYFCGYLVSLSVTLMVFRFKQPQIEEARKNSDIFRYGTMTQVANLAQQFNYRLSYIVVKDLFGLSTLGLFALTVQCAEFIWRVPRSLAVVQYTRIAATTDKVEQLRLTGKITRLNLTIAFVTAVIIALLPEEFILYFVGSAYVGIKEMLLYLLPGVVLFSGAITLSPLFSGRGQYHVPMIISLIVLALLFTAFEIAKTTPDLISILIIVTVMYASFFFTYAAILKLMDGMKFREYVPRWRELREMIRFKL